MRSLLLAACVGLCLSGCQTTVPGVRYDWRGHDAISLDVAAASVTVVSLTSFEPVIPTPPVPGVCPSCNNTGYITHGDGHQTPCPDCSSGSAGSPSSWLGISDLTDTAKQTAQKINTLLDNVQNNGLSITVQTNKTPKAWTPFQQSDCANGACTIGGQTSGSCPSGSCGTPQQSTGYAPRGLFFRRR